MRPPSQPSPKNPRTGFLGEGVGDWRKKEPFPFRSKSLPQIPRSLEFGDALRMILAKVGGGRIAQLPTLLSKNPNGCWSQTRQGNPFKNESAYSLL